MSRLARRAVRQLAALRCLHSPSDVWLFGRVTCFAAAVPLLVRLPLPRLAALLGRAGKGRSLRSPDGGPAQLAGYVLAAQQAGAPFIRGGCLTRGVTLYWFLARSGYPVELCFGIGEVETEMAGHCWVTVAGDALLEPVPPEDLFSFLYRIPAS